MSAIAHPGFPELNWPLTRRQFALLSIWLACVLPIAAVLRMRSPIEVTRHNGDFSGEFDPHDFDVSYTAYRPAWSENAPMLVIYDGSPGLVEVVRPGNSAVPV